MLVPALVGYGLGVHTFGDPDEVYRLNLHQRQYQKEFVDYKNELYYT